jgi:Glycosyl hydrolases family 2, TIM barrel domain/Glycosyl hydrolases family 2, sugar binding domain/Glycosyl hydrolases family 2
VFESFRMRPSLIALSVVAMLAVAAPAGAQSVVSTPTPRTLYKTGPSGRFLMGGTWLFKLDNHQSGPQLDAGTAGWKAVKVPNAWNAGDDTAQSFLGGVGWYRKDFRFPSNSKKASWVVRFESVNYRSKIWLNGKPIGKNRGAYLPFEIRLPAGMIKRGRVNRLVIRVDSRRKQTDFPPSGLSIIGKPTGGWWNYGGLLREVYLRKINDIDFNTVVVRPDLPCATCSASVTYRVTVRNYGGRARRVKVTARFGNRRLTVGTAAVGAKRFATLTKRITVNRPHLWSPATPNLYDASLRATSGGRVLQTYTLETGIRSIKVVDGHLFLNGAPMNFRGVALHEDSRQFGFAIDNKIRDQELAWVKELGATVIRSHYPLAPYTQERADELGIMQWSEIPVYSIKTQYLKQKLVRQLAARELASNIQTNGNHPSVIVWSIGNELSARPGPVQGDYIRRAVQTAHELDPSRPVGLAVAGYPSAGCQPEYGPIDVIGINDYFGWYPGPNGQIADRTLLSDYLDSVRQCYPNKALVITEFGAEANRDGPVEEKGTYAFQQDFVNFHLGIYATKPWLSGAIYFALQEFRVRPDWDGGNPRPQPPIHQKGLVSFDGVRKPAFFDVQRIFKATKQFRSRPRAGL